MSGETTDTVAMAVSASRNGKAAAKGKKDSGKVDAKSPEAEQPRPAAHKVSPEAWEAFSRLVPQESMPAGWSCTDGGVRYCDGTVVAGAPIGVFGARRLAAGDGSQLMLAFVDMEDNLREMAIDRSLLGNPRDVLRQLLGCGALVHPGEAPALADYINAFRPRKFSRLVKQPGWVDDPFSSPCFAYCSEQIGEMEGGGMIAFEAPEDNRVQAALVSRGTLEEWQQRVAGPIRGLSLPIFGVCAAMAAPLVRLAGDESLGWHFYAETSRGKTTLLQVCASVFGRGAASGGGEPSLVQSWNTTDNGVEPMASASNDLPLFLDELKVGDAESLGKIIYMLSQGQGKNRMTRSQRQAPQYKWRVALFSTGEMSVRELMSAARKPLHAGQEVRLLSILVEEDDYGKGAAELVNGLKRASRECCGTAGREWVHGLVSMCLDPAWDQNAFRAQVDIFARRVAAGCGNLQPEQERVTRYFGLVAMAGYLAFHMDILPYTEEEVQDAVNAVFKRWLAAAATLTETDRAILRLQETMLRENRYFPLATEGKSKVPPPMAKVLGWRTMVGIGPMAQEYYVFTPKDFKELCAKDGARAGAVSAKLVKAGLMLASNETGKKYQRHWTPPLGRHARHYFVSAKLMDLDLDRGLQVKAEG